MCNGIDKANVISVEFIKKCYSLWSRRDDLADGYITIILASSYIYVYYRMCFDIKILVHLKLCIDNFKYPVDA